MQFMQTGSAYMSRKIVCSSRIWPLDWMILRFSYSEIGGYFSIFWVPSLLVLALGDKVGLPSELSPLIDTSLVVP